MVSDPDIDRRKGSVSVEDQDLKLTLKECLRKILEVHPRYALVLNMIYEGYRAVEICKELSIKRNNFYVILNRGRAVLKLCLETGRV
jgi:DNA-directed RNA polymerase specialized sigma24 family protein